MAYPTNPIYKFGKSLSGEITKIMTIEGDYLVEFPLVDGNRHYEAYKEWVAEGNTAEAAD